MEFTLSVTFNLSRMIGMKQSQGLTLPELLITLSIIAILIGIGTPSFKTLIEHRRSELVMDQLKQLIYFTRYKAIQTGGYVIMCPSINSVKCSNNWLDPIIVFNDQNMNKAVDTNEVVSRMLKPLQNGETLKLRASANKKYLLFNGRGFTHGLFGNLTFCQANQTIKGAHRLTINRLGRVRIHKDLDGDGIIDGSSSRPIAC